MFCGLGHADMRFQVRVLAPAAFDAWARAHGRPA
jgi:heme/copper-type cytochrome/quinol oxidase subunit 2